MNKKTKIIIYIFFGIYILLSIFKMYYHEPWRDEAQAWLLARDSSIFELFDGIKRDGHPLLWTLCLKVLTTLGLPYISMQIFHLILNCIVVYLILFKAPFKISIRVLMIFSDIISYEYLVKSRNYILPVLIIILLAMLYKERFKKPFQFGLLLILLLNTVVYYTGIVVAILMVYIYDIVKMYIRDKNIKELIYLIITSITVILNTVFLMSLYPNNNPDEVLVKLFIPNTLSDITSFIANAFSIYKESFSPLIDPKYIIGVLLGIILFLVFVKFFKGKTRIIYILSTSFVLFFSVFAYHSGNRHYYINLIVLLFCFWITYSERTQKGKLYVSINYLMAIILIISSGFAIVNSYKDIKYLYSDSKNVADYINQNYSEYTVITYSSLEAMAVVPYIKNKFWSVEDENFYTYIPWTKNYNLERKGYDLKYAEVSFRVDKTFKDKSKVLLLLCKKSLFPIYTNELVKIYSTKDIILTSEGYLLYKYK